MSNERVEISGQSVETQVCGVVTPDKQVQPLRKRSATTLGIVTKDTQTVASTVVVSAVLLKRLAKVHTVPTNALQRQWTLSPGIFRRLRQLSEYSLRLMFILQNVLVRKLLSVQAVPIATMLGGGHLEVKYGKTSICGLLILMKQRKRS